MSTTDASTPKTGTKLVLGLLALAMIVSVGLRWYHSSVEEETSVLQQQGMPAVRTGIGLSQEGRKLLAQEEQKELETLYSDAFQSIRPEERQRFFALAGKGTGATDLEISESGALVQKAIEMLPEQKRERLFALVAKSVQLAQQKAAENKPEGK
ncbi:MAG: hypothetical protein HYZ50_04885 [Deltaproteobacteria bacterium]|nr:hypothetical protein [Deltaproteobacteria bacterium]